jgi:hypothetical protein
LRRQFIVQSAALLGLLTTSAHGQGATITVHADQVQHRLSRYLTGACIEDVNHELYGGIDSQMIFGESFAEPAPEHTSSDGGVSGAWRTFRRKTADGKFSLETQTPFVRNQSQQITFASGTGEIGIENEGLNRRGMYFVKDRKYEGYIFARSESPTEVFVSLESRDGQSVYAQKRLKVSSREWQRLDLTLKPSRADTTGRFAISLNRPGSVTLGYAFLQAGPWGRFKGLPVRKDVAQGLLDQGITVLRLGGSMVNAAEYRWKNMIGPRAHRPPYSGWWHPHSSNGWGIFEFLSFCEASGFAAVPAVNADETPQDMADFIEYANGPADTAWGRKRAEDGHPKPYHLKYLEIGNEEKVNENYWRKFKPVAEAIWGRDPSIILVVGDFAYGKPIQDPFNFSGAAGGVSNLAAQQKILRLAKQHDREVWFDVHIGTEGPRPDFGGTFSYIDALDKISEGSKHRVVIFEFNAGNHSQRRALANAAAINAVERDGRLPIATSANCLQPDGQNDNNWDQGLLFLNNSRVWLQPPGYVTQMISGNYEPLAVKSEVTSPGDILDLSAKRSEDGKTLVLQVVNFSDQKAASVLIFEGFAPEEPFAQVQTLAGPLDARNTAENPELIEPSSIEWRHGLQDGRASYTFPADSFTVIRLR